MPEQGQRGIVRRLRDELGEPARAVWRLLRNDLPALVVFETDTRCNRRCGYCPNAYHVRPHARMSMEMFTQILARLAAANYQGEIAFGGFGEPTLDERLVEFVYTAAQWLPGRRIIVFTNGATLTMADEWALARAGVRYMVLTRHEAQRPRQEKRERWVGPMRVYERTAMREVFSLGGWGAIPGVKYRRWPQMIYCRRQAEMNIAADGRLRFCCGDFDASSGYGPALPDPVATWRRAAAWRARMWPALGWYRKPICRACGVAKLAA